MLEAVRRRDGRLGDDQAPKVEQASGDPVHTSFVTVKPTAPLQMTPGWLPVIPPFAMLGTRDESGEPSITLPYGHTVCWATPSRRLTKDEVELWQLGQFCSDLYTATGRQPASGGVEKGEAPDFIVRENNGSSLGVELAAFTPGARRAHESHVERFRAQMAASTDSYRHLAGCHISLSIEDPRNPTKVMTRERSRILDCLRDVGRPAPLGPYGPSSSTKICEGEGWEVHGYELWAAEQLPPSADGIPIFDVVFTLEQTLSEVADGVRRLIAGHKYDGIDWLIVPISGPDTNGIAFLEDDALIGLVLEQGAFPTQSAGTADMCVLLHFWMTGAIREVFPSDSEICPPRQDHQRRMTILGYHMGDLYCAPLSQPAVHCLNCTAT